MTLARLFGGNYPYITNVPVYDSADIATGEMIMEHASMTDEATKYYITAAGSSTAEALDALGVIQAGSDNCYASKENSAFYKIGSDTYPDFEADEGLNFQPCIVNPDATYFAFIDQADAVGGAACSASTTLTISGIQDHLDGAYLYTTTTTDSAATYSGKLRYITVDDATDLTLAVAITMDTSTDLVFIFPIGCDSVGLNAEATGIRPGGTGTTPSHTASGTVEIKAFEQWIVHAQAPKHKLRYWNDRGLDDLSDVILEQEIVMFCHAFHMA